MTGSGANVPSARRRAVAFIAAFVGVVAVPSVIAIACTDITGSSNSILSLQFDT